MRLLSENTVKSYNNTQLLRHLDRIMSKYFNDEPYRINYQSGTVHLLDHNDYLFFCSTDNREMIWVAIWQTWQMIDRCFNPDSLKQLSEITINHIFTKMEILDPAETYASRHLAHMNKNDMVHMIIEARKNRKLNASEY